MAENNVNNASESIFRKKTLERISSPEQLTDYLRITTPGVWVVMSAIIFLLLGLFFWTMTGTLQTKVDVKVNVENQTATVIPVSSDTLVADMPLQINSNVYVIAYTGTDEYGRVYGIADVDDLPDGVYDGTAVIEAIHPIQFLINSN